MKLYCFNFSGGPIQISHSDASCVYEIVGVVSFGFLKCGTLPGIYTRVATYIDWIERTVWPNAEE